MGGEKPEMRLNGWMRIAIVLSLVWEVGSALSSERG